MSFSEFFNCVDHRNVDKLMNTKKSVCDVTWRDIKTDHTWTKYDLKSCLIKGTNNEIYYSYLGDWVGMNVGGWYDGANDVTIDKYAILQSDEELEKLKVDDELSVKKCKFSPDNPPIGYIFREKKHKDNIYYPLNVNTFGIEFNMNNRILVKWEDLMDNWECAANKTWYSCYINEETND